jgi:hypothetical protein
LTSANYKYNASSFAGVSYFCTGGHITGILWEEKMGAGYFMLVGIVACPYPKITDIAKSQR